MLNLSRPPWPLFDFFLEFSLQSIQLRIVSLCRAIFFGNKDPNSSKRLYSTSTSHSELSENILIMTRHNVRVDDVSSVRKMRPWMTTHERKEALLCATVSCPTISFSLRSPFCKSSFKEKELYLVLPVVRIDSVIVLHWYKNNHGPRSPIPQGETAD